MTQIFYKHQFLRGKFYLSYENDEGSKSMRIFRFNKWADGEKSSISSGVCYNAVVFRNFPNNEIVLLEAQILSIYEGPNDCTQYLCFNHYEYFQLSKTEVNKMLIDCI